jgi:mRNA interferase MazF
VQATDLLWLSTVLVSPTSTSARAASFRPVIDVNGSPKRVLAEQTAVVDPERLGPLVGRLAPDELQAVDDALALVLGL